MSSGLERSDAVMIQGWKFFAKKRKEKGKNKRVILREKRRIKKRWLEGGAENLMKLH